MVFAMKDNKRNQKYNDGSSLAIALFFFMVCSLICAGVLSVANSSLVGVSKGFDSDNVQNYVPPPLPSPEPTSEIDPNFENESKTINLVYDTLVNDFDTAFTSVETTGQGHILHSTNPRSMSYEMISYINSYINNSKKENNGVTYLVPVDDEGDMLPLTYVVTVSGISVDVVIDLDGTAANGSTPQTVANTRLVFSTFKITVSAHESECTYTRTYTYTVPNDGKYYFKWVGAGGGLPKRFIIQPY